MGLSDVVGSSGTTGFAQVGFVISFVVFLLIVLWALTRSRNTMHTIAQSVLSDGHVDRGDATNEDSPHG